MIKLAALAADQGKHNVAFMCYFLLGNIEACIDLLCSINRIPEAAFLARTYAPSHVSRIVKLWRKDLEKVNPKAAESLADPMEYENLFPDIKLALQAEELLNVERKHPSPASTYPDLKDGIARDMIAEMRARTDSEKGGDDGLIVLDEAIDGLSASTGEGEGDGEEISLDDDVDLEKSD